MADLLGFAIMGFMIALGSETCKVVHEWYVKPFMERRRESLRNNIGDLGRIVKKKDDEVGGVD